MLPLLVVYHDLNQPAKAVESYLLLGLTSYLVAESAELAWGSAFQGLEYFQGSKVDLGGLARARYQRGIDHPVL